MTDVDLLGQIAQRTESRIRRIYVWHEVPSTEVWQHDGVLVMSEEVYREVCKDLSPEERARVDVPRPWGVEVIEVTDTARELEMFQDLNMLPTMAGILEELEQDMKRPMKPPPPFFASWGKPGEA